MSESMSSATKSNRATHGWIARAHAAARLVSIALPPLLLAGALAAAPKGASTAKKPPTSKSSKADAAAEVSSVDAGAPKESAPKPTDAGVDPSGNPVRETERKEGDASVKVFEFGMTEIEGRSRWPAISYFVRRMRAEFEAQKLPHRPFLPELEATKGDPAVK
jgi:hypothetical protein